MESQCQNQQGGYAPVWMHHLRVGKLSMQNDLRKVSVWYKLSSHKIIIKTSGLCPSVSISKTNIHEKSTTNHTSSDRNESLLLEVIVVIWREYLISSKERACLDVNWCLWDQPLMKGLCPSIGQTLEWLNSTACSHQCPCLDPIISKKCQQWWEGYALVITSKISTNHIPYSDVKWKRTSDIPRGMDMTQKSIINWEEYAST